MRGKTFAKVSSKNLQCNLFCSFKQQTSTACFMRSFEKEYHNFQGYVIELSL